MEHDSADEAKGGYLSYPDESLNESGSTSLHIGDGARVEAAASGDDGGRNSRGADSAGSDRASDFPPSAGGPANGRGSGVNPYHDIGVRDGRDDGSGSGRGLHVNMDDGHGSDRSLNGRGPHHGGDSDSNRGSGMSGGDDARSGGGYSGEWASVGLEDGGDLLPLGEDRAQVAVRDLEASVVAGGGSQRILLDLRPSLTESGVGRSEGAVERGGGAGRKTIQLLNPGELPTMPPLSRSSKAVSPSGQQSDEAVAEPNLQKVQELQSGASKLPIVTDESFELESKKSAISSKILSTTNPMSNGLDQAVVKLGASEARVKESPKDASDADRALAGAGDRDEWQRNSSSSSTRASRTFSLRSPLISLPPSQPVQQPAVSNLQTTDLPTLAPRPIEMQVPAPGGGSNLKLASLGGMSGGSLASIDAMWRSPRRDVEAGRSGAAEEKDEEVGCDLFWPAPRVDLSPALVNRSLPRSFLSVSLPSTPTPSPLPRSKAQAVDENASPTAAVDNTSGESAVTCTNEVFPLRPVSQSYTPPPENEPLMVLPCTAPDKTTPLLHLSALGGAAFWLPSSTEFEMHRSVAQADAVGAATAWLQPGPTEAACPPTSSETGSNPKALSLPTSFMQKLGDGGKELAPLSMSSTALVSTPPTPPPSAKRLEPPPAWVGVAAAAAEGLVGLLLEVRQARDDAKTVNKMVETSGKTSSAAILAASERERKATSAAAAAVERERLSAARHALKDAELRTAAKLTVTAAAAAAVEAKRLLDDLHQSQTALDSELRQLRAVSASATAVSSANLVTDSQSASIPTGGVIGSVMPAVKTFEVTEEAENSASARRVRLLERMVTQLSEENAEQVRKKLSPCVQSLA